MIDMTVTLGELPGDNPYLQLGRTIAGQCPGGFEEAKLDAELGEGSAAMRLVCTPGGGSGTPRDIDPVASDQIRTLLETIRDGGTEGERSWRRCTVTLRKGGGFSLDIHD